MLTEKGSEFLDAFKLIEIGIELISAIILFLSVIVSVVAFNTNKKDIKGKQKLAIKNLLRNAYCDLSVLIENEGNFELNPILDMIKELTKIIQDDYNLLSIIDYDLFKNLRYISSEFSETGKKLKGRRLYNYLEGYINKTIDMLEEKYNFSEKDRMGMKFGGDKMKTIKILLREKNELLQEKEMLGNQRASLGGRIDAINEKIAELNIQIKAQQSKGLIVSEHAILRYLERVQGVNLEDVKNEILNSIDEEQLSVCGSGTFPSTVNQARFKVINNTVVTVLI